MSVPFDGPPLDPSSPEAQQWLRDELSKSKYVTEPSLFQRFVEWVLEHLRIPSSGLGLPSWAVALAILVVLAVVVLVVLRLVRPEAITHRRGAEGTGAVDDEGLSAADYRARAQVALERADWDAALLDAYRALAASAVERTLLVELPGRTAHEVAVALAPTFPDHAAALAGAAAAFDDVRYGHRSVTPEQARDASHLDAALLRARPHLAAVAGS